MGQFSTKYEVIASRPQGHRHLTAKQNKREYISVLKHKSAVLSFVGTEPYVPFCGRNRGMQLGRSHSLLQTQRRATDGRPRGVMTGLWERTAWHISGKV